MMMLPTLTLFLASLPLPLPSPQDQGDTTPTVYVRLGDRYARILKVEGDQVTVSFRNIPGSRSTLSAKILPADTLYEFHAASADSSKVADWRKLAEFAAEHGLPMRQIDALNRIALLDPEQAAAVAAKITTIRSQCADRALESAQEMVRDGDLQDASEALEELTKEFVGFKATKQAQELLTKVERKLKSKAADAAMRDRAEKATEAQPSPELIEQVFGGIQRALSRGRASMEKALEEGDEYVRAKRLLQTSLDHLERAQDRLAEIDADDESPALVKVRKRLKRSVRRALARAHIELGYVYVALGVSPSAYRHASRAAALTPESPRVSALRLAIAARNGR